MAHDENENENENEPKPPVPCETKDCPNEATGAWRDNKDDRVGDYCDPCGESTRWMLGEKEFIRLGGPGVRKVTVEGKNTQNWA